MYFARLIARQWGLATVLGMAALVGQVQAQTPSQSLDDGSKSTYLKLDGASSRNYFVRFGYTYIKPNTKAGTVYDVTGPAIGYREGINLVNARKLKGLNGTTCTNSGPDDYLWGPGPNAQTQCRTWGQTISSPLDESMAADGISGLGIPPLLSSEAVGAGSFTIQAGIFLDDDHKWTVEPYVFGVPFENKVYATGNNSLSGQLVITTQQLPITVVMNRYFGDKNSIFRPSLGLGATYAIFFNTQSTDAMNTYAGGNTDVKIKNAFGVGPFAGLQVKLAENWHLSAQMGYVKLKTSATLTTHDTKLTDGVTLGAVVKDTTLLLNTPGYHNTVETLCTLVCTGGVYDPANPGNIKVAQFLKAIQDANGGSLGTFTRKQDVSLDPYVFSLAIGYEF